MNIDNFQAGLAHPSFEVSNIDNILSWFGDSDMSGLKNKNKKEQALL